MTLPLWMPGAVQKPVSYRAEAGRWVQAPIGWILHVVVGNGSPYGTFESAQSPDRRFSHLWVSKAGLIEQYQSFDMKSWAQGVGNGLYFAVETEGFPNEPLDDAQIAALGRIDAFLGLPNVEANAPGQAGIGTHYMGGIAWGGHTCPDPSSGAGPRSRQRVAIITASGRAPLVASPIPQVFLATPPVGTDRRRVARLQQLLEVVPDGLWGSGTDGAGQTMNAACLSHLGYPHNTVSLFLVRQVQAIVNVTTDSIWGPHTQAALLGWAKQLQSVLGVAVDGAWGPASQTAYLRLRNANLGKF